MKRRDFIKRIPVAASIPLMLGNRRASAMLSSPFVPALNSVNPDNDRVLVVVYLEGGNDGLNTLVPFENPTYDLNRPKIGFTSSDEKNLLTFKPRLDLGFNPQMNSLQPLWEEGKLVIVQNVGYTDANLSHFRSGEIWASASNAAINELTGWGARYLQSVYPDFQTQPPTDPMALSIGSYQSALFYGQAGPMNIRTDDPTNFLSTLKQSSALVPKTQGGTETLFVRGLMNLTENYAARFASLFPAAAVNTVAYPDSQIARDLSKVAWCIGAGMKTKMYFVHLGGFDTHFSQFSKDASQWGQAQLLKQLSEALTAFQRDLEGLHQDKRVVTVTYSEFGRRVAGTGPVDSGTDHGTAAPQFIIGSLVNGELYGKHPNLDDLDDSGNLKNEFEFRKLYAALLQDWLGATPDSVARILHPQETSSTFDTTFPVNSSAAVQPLFIDDPGSVPNSGTKTVITDLGVTPNPIRSGGAHLTFSAGAAVDFDADLFDVGGRHLLTIHRGSVDAGARSIRFDVSSLANGAYILRASDGAMMQTRLVNIAK